jgi:HlyD family secretion protein
MKKSTIILLVLIPAAAVATWLYVKQRQKNEPVSLVTAKAEYGYIAKSVTATGIIQPVDTVIVGAQVSGVVKAVYADFNYSVKQGQLLAKVDPSIISAQIDQARATLANAKSNLDYQKSNYDRQQQLYDLGAISKADYQVAINQYGSAKAAVNNAGAQVKLTTRNLYYTNIYSPINGVVLNKNVAAGQTIASSFSAPTLFVIAKDLSKIQVNANVDEADIGGVRQKQNVTFTVDAFPDEVFRGTVQKIYLHPSVSANVVTYPTLINIDNREMKLRPGMTASITIYVEEDSNALLIPTKALSFKPDSAIVKSYVIKNWQKPANYKGGKYNGSYHLGNTNKEKAETGAEIHYSVWIKKGDTLMQRRVLVGMNDGSFAQVLKGLGDRDEVITDVLADSKAMASNVQRSPFMPQMRRPSGGQQQGRRNQ